MIRVSFIIDEADQTVESVTEIVQQGIDAGGSRIIIGNTMVFDVQPTFTVEEV